MDASKGKTDMEQARIPPYGRAWASEDLHAIIDLGRDDECPRRAETLVALGLSRRDFCVWIQGRLVARVKHARYDEIVQAGAPIAKGGTYYQTTHHWIGLGEDETMAAAFCPDYDRAEIERNDAARRVAGSLIHSTWKHWGRGTRETSKALGGARSFGINTPLRVETVARVHGIGPKLSGFLDSCPSWQRADIGRIAHLVAVEAAARVAPLRSWIDQSLKLDQMLAASTSWDAQVPMLADPRKLDFLEAADARHKAAGAAAQAVMVLQYGQWMKIDHFERGRDIVFPAMSACGSARRAAGWAAVMDLPLPKVDVSEGGRSSIWNWQDKVEAMAEYKAGMAAEQALQVEQLVKLSACAPPTSPTSEEWAPRYMWDRRLAADAGFRAAVEAERTRLGLDRKAA